MVVVVEAVVEMEVKTETEKSIGGRNDGRIGDKRWW